MRKIGLVLVALSILIGGAALWTISIISSSRADATPTTAPTVQVVVASRSIAFGQPVTLDAVRLQDWPASAIPPGAFHDVASLTAQHRVAIAPIAPNEPILPGSISGRGGRATLAGLIRTGMRAATIRVDDVLGVAGFVLPGDSVDVLVTRSERGDRSSLRADTLVRNIRVLAVDQMADQGRTTPTVAKAVTVEVTPRQAEKIALAAQMGALSLALRRADERGDRATSSATLVSDLADQPPTHRYRGNRHHRARTDWATDHTMQVWRGGEIARVTVSREQGVF